VSKVLVVHDGKRERELLLVERLVVGRDPTCDISVDDGLLSRRHAEFVAAASAVTVRDLGSRNGVFVNGTRRAEQALNPGDVVQIGPLRVRYLRDRPVVPGGPSPADAEGTLMIPGLAVRRRRFPSPLPASLDGFRAPASAGADIDETGRRVSWAPGRSQKPRKSAAIADGDATRLYADSSTGPDALGPLCGCQARICAVVDAHSGPRRGARQRDTVNQPGLCEISRAEPWVGCAVNARESPAVLPRTSNQPALGSFVLIQLGALAIIVFVSTVAPVILARGTVLNAIDGGSVTALLVWPILPLVIGLAATLVIANIINRRVDALGASRQRAEGR
jgi:hypothetical protein